jgi:hypothetical protein
MPPPPPPKGSRPSGAPSTPNDSNQANQSRAATPQHQTQTQGQNPPPSQASQPAQNEPQSQQGNASQAPPAHGTNATGGAATGQGSGTTSRAPPPRENSQGQQANASQAPPSHGTNATGGDATGQSGGTTSRAPPPRENPPPRDENRSSNQSSGNPSQQTQQSQRSQTQSHPPPQSHSTAHTNQDAETSGQYTPRREAHRTAAPESLVQTSIVVSGAKRIVTAEDEPTAPFGNEPTLDMVFELDGVNYALYEGLRELDDAKRKTFDNEAHQCVWSALQSFNISPQNIHVRIGPGTISAVLLRYQAGMYPTLLDADWTMRLHVTIRTSKNNNSDLSKALAAYGRSVNAFSGLLRAYQTLFDRIVERVTVSIVEDPLEATQMVRNASRTQRSVENRDSRVIESHDSRVRDTRRRRFDPESEDRDEDLGPGSRNKRRSALDDGAERRSASYAERRNRNTTTEYRGRRIYDDEAGDARWRSDSDDYIDNDWKPYRAKRTQNRGPVDSDEETDVEYNRTYVDRNRRTDRYTEPDYDEDDRQRSRRGHDERNTALVPTSRRYHRDDWPDESSGGYREMTRRSHISRSPGREFYLKVTECEPFKDW